MDGQETFMPPGEEVEEVVKYRGWKGNRDNLAIPTDTARKNAAYLNFALKTWNLKRVDTSDVQAIADRILWYFGICEENNMKPTVAGLANSLGVTRMVLWNWRNGIDRPANADIILRAYDKLEELWEMYMMNGMINPASGIFLGKNLFGYKDVQDIIVQPNNPLGETVEAEFIEEKYMELPDE